MIKQNKRGQTTTVQFGDKLSASVGLTGSRGRLVIQQIVSDAIGRAVIGLPFAKDDVSELPKVVLNFTEVESVQALIDVLTAVKRKMIEHEFPPYCYAC